MTRNRIKIFYPVVFIAMMVILTSSFLVITEKVTRAAIAANEDQQTLELMQEIFPQAVFYIYNDNTEIFTLYNSSNKEIGYALYGEGYGYQSEIVVLIGLEDITTIKNIVIVSEYETLSYINRIYNSNFFDQFIGLKIEDCFPSYSWLPGGVDSVSGSTISSRAITNAVREAALEKIQYLG
jgi:electron transport complex protein RnfG